MIEFITSFKNTPYYQKLINNPKVLMIYLGGSYCNETASNNSDYDLTIITNDTKAVDDSKFVFLTYKGKKVHWYHFPIKDFITGNLREIWLLGSIYFKNFRESLIIYKNSLYNELLDKLITNKDIISNLTIYKFFDTNKFEVKSIIKQITKYKTSTFSKNIYHLCMCGAYLTNTFDKAILNDIKNNYYRLNIDLQQKALEYLTLGLDYISNFPVDYRKELNELYDRISQ